MGSLGDNTTGPHLMEGTRGWWQLLEQLSGGDGHTLADTQDTQGGTWSSGLGLHTGELACFYLVFIQGNLLASGGILPHLLLKGGVGGEEAAVALLETATPGA